MSDGGLGGLTMAADRVDGVVDQLDVSDEVRGLATEFADRADWDHPINRSPAAVAAGAIYLAGLLANEKRTQAAIAEAGDVSEVAIRQTYVEIAEHEDIPMGRDEMRARARRSRRDRVNEVLGL